MATFRVGDRVRVVTTHPANPLFGRDGETGIVTACRPCNCAAEGYGNGPCGNGDVEVQYDGRDAWWIHSQHLEHLDIVHTSGDLAMALQLARLIEGDYIRIDPWNDDMKLHGVADWLRLCVERELGQGE